MLDFEVNLYNEKIKLIAGTDEAGRGPIAGPVVAAAVILPKDYKNELINDSKQLSEKQRYKLEEVIKKDAITYSVIFIDAKKIDEINILEASRLAMEMALHSLKEKYDLVITDCMKLYHENCEVIPLVKGDAKAINVAAASILAKTARDRYMIELSKKYPEYKFDKHKGYPTKEHLEIIKKHGIIKELYRETYGPVKNLKCIQLSLFEK